MDLPVRHTLKNQYWKFETNNPRKGTARPQFQFPHSCVCERFIYSHNRSAYSAAGSMWTDPSNILIAHRQKNVETGTEAEQFPEKEYINGFFVAVHLQDAPWRVWGYWCGSVTVHVVQLTVSLNKHVILKNMKYKDDFACTALRFSSLAQKTW